ncbi:GWxTD domain-containing protein [Larkinella soli]|uniref:GWxTD domain-containing protein n=1 Tax=Larkinella soli TaxID=1770527 RepID=UPI000FFBAB34|nr:GWxTD domain-containing protein [Larkinella soli]
MRLIIILLSVLVFGACSTGRRAIPADPSSGRTDRPADRPTASRPAPVPQSAQPVAQNWRITSTKALFLIKDSTSVRVFVNLTVRKGEQRATVEDFTSRYMLNYVIYPDYNSRERLGYGNVPLTAESVVRDTSPESGDVLIISFDVKRPANSANGVMLAEFTDINSGKKTLHDLPIRFRSTKLGDRFAFFDPKTNLLQQRHYVNAGDTVVLRDLAGTSRPLNLYRYRHDFDPAQSPMNTTPRPAPKSLGVDSSMSVSTNQPFVFQQEGLYYFQADTADAYGIGLVVADHRYPKLTRPEKLIKPVLYMSTNTEATELNNAADAKKALDRYWLTLMSGDQNLARKAIRAYYSRVEEANRLFTTYKEGWKTDKGMIYIILGSPDRVQRSRDREVWVYNQRANVSEINFTFNRKPNQFVEDHYELVRYVEYQPVWYPVVEAWRTGAIRE